MSGLRVSVVIPVKDDALRLRACLEALARQTLPAGAFEVVVADDGSADDPAAAAAGFAFVRFAPPGRPGPSAARNRGLAASRAPALAFTDADCEPRPDWLEAGLRGLEAFPGGGFLAGRVEVVPRDPARLSAPELFDMAHAFDQRLFVERWHFGATANVFVSRAAAEAAGGFDERVAHYGEDVDFGRRLWKAGVPMAYAPAAVVRHPARPGWAGLRARQAKAVRAEYGERPATLRRLALDLWHDGPAPGAILRDLVHPAAPGAAAGLKLAAASAAVRAFRAAARFNLFWEQRRSGGRAP